MDACSSCLLSCGLRPRQKEHDFTFVHFNLDMQKIPVGFLYFMSHTSFTIKFYRRAGSPRPQIIIIQQFLIGTALQSLAVTGLVAGHLSRRRAGRFASYGGNACGTRLRGFLLGSSDLVGEGGRMWNFHTLPQEDLL